MNWPSEPVFYNWTPHPAYAEAAPAQAIPCWGPTSTQARVTAFLLTALSIRRLA